MKKQTLLLFALTIAVTGAFSSSRRARLNPVWIELQTYIPTVMFTEAKWDGEMKYNLSIYCSPVMDPDELNCIVAAPDMVCAILVDLDYNGVPGFQQGDLPPHRPWSIMYHDVP